MCGEGGENHWESFEDNAHLIPNSSRCEQDVDQSA